MTSANADLLKWLNECLARGHSAESLTASALQTGWHEAVVRATVAEAVGRELIANRDGARAGQRRARARSHASADLHSDLGSSR